MDAPKKKQLATFLSWGTGVGIAFLIIGDTIWTMLVGCGFTTLFGGLMLLMKLRTSKQTKNRAKGSPS